MWLDYSFNPDLISVFRKKKKKNHCKNCVVSPLMFSRAYETLVLKFYSMKTDVSQDLLSSISPSCRHGPVGAYNDATEISLMKLLLICSKMTNWVWKTLTHNMLKSQTEASGWSQRLTSLLRLKENHWLLPPADLHSPAALLCSLVVPVSFLPLCPAGGQRGRRGGWLNDYSKGAWTKEQDATIQGWGSFLLVPVFGCKVFCSTLFHVKRSPLPTTAMSSLFLYC